MPFVIINNNGSAIKSVERSLVLDKVAHTSLNLVSKIRSIKLTPLKRKYIKSINNQEPGCQVARLPAVC